MNRFEDYKNESKRIKNNIDELEKKAPRNKRAFC